MAILLGSPPNFCSREEREKVSLTNEMRESSISCWQLRGKGETEVGRTYSNVRLDPIHRETTVENTDVGSLAFPERSLAVVGSESVPWEGQPLKREQESGEGDDEQSETIVCVDGDEVTVLPYPVAEIIVCALRVEEPASVGVLVETRLVNTAGKREEEGEKRRTDLHGELVASLCTRRRPDPELWSKDGQ
jgi:hypothetical protein